MFVWVVHVGDFCQIPFSKIAIHLQWEIIFWKRKRLAEQSAGNEEEPYSEILL